MEIYALVGESGTGKSYHAMEVAEDYHIRYLIDDGLLIHNGKKIAGQSAKAEDTMVAAVKRAVFLDPKHAEETRLAIKKYHPQKILILGTSEHMIDRIIEALSLPAVKKYIFIEEISSPENIKLARDMRRQGKHVIPLPVVEVKKDLPNFWIDPLVDFFKRKKKNPEMPIEKSIVRPTFSQLGKITISEQVVVQIVHHIAQSFETLKQYIKISVRLEEFGVRIYCESKMRYGEPIQKYIRPFQQQVKNEVEKFTGLEVMTIDIRVLGVLS